jgi:NADPH-dependent glutamate synthase beta subunit-like oxidoreductase
MKDGKRTNLRTINLYRPRRMNPRGRPTEIQIACLESRAEMPAFASEIDQVLEEGGVLQPSWGPKRVLANGRLQRIELVHCTHVFDDSGRFNPSFDPSVTTIIEADTVILAIG